MKTVPKALADHLAGEVTTLCHAWIVTRLDGEVLGFTDHDFDLDVAGVTCLAASGFSATEAEVGLGLPVDQAEVAGVLSHMSIRAEDLRAGLYDGASVARFLVNWQSPHDVVEVNRADLGEVTMEGEAFRAELRSPAHRLEQPQGRVYSHRCDAILGDGRCGVDLTRPAYHASVQIVAIPSPGRLVVAGLDGFNANFARNGTLEFQSGPLGGRSFDIEDQAIFAAGNGVELATLALWLPLRSPPDIGDIALVTIGCSKSFLQCRDGFDNQINFQGFPHMPGADFAYAHVDGESEHDGSPIHD